jgi:hypothetical protein
MRRARPFSEKENTTGHEIFMLGERFIIYGFHLVQFPFILYFRYSRFLLVNIPNGEGGDGKPRIEGLEFSILWDWGANDSAACFPFNSLCFPLSLLSVFPPFLTLAVSFQLASISHSTCLFFMLLEKAFIFICSRNLEGDIVRYSLI